MTLASEKIIEELGGAEAIRQRGDLFRQVVDFFTSHEKALIAEHPHEWVVVLQDKSLLFGTSPEDVMAEAARTGRRDLVVIVRYLDPNPPSMFL